MSCSGDRKKTGSRMEKEASAREASWGMGGLTGSPERPQETTVERRGLNSASGHRGDSLLEVLYLEPFCSHACFRLRLYPCSSSVASPAVPGSCQAPCLHLLV